MIDSRFASATSTPTVFPCLSEPCLSKFTPEAKVPITALPVWFAYVADAW